MSEISLEWFFQIPGLFITIGVLLILVALLVLIIGSSKAKSKKTEEVSDEVSTPSVPVANPSETVNVVAPTNENVLGVNNDDVSSNNSSQLNELANNVNKIVEPVAVDNVDNIMPVGEASPSIVTPVNLSESVLEKPIVETVDVSEVTPVISEPVIKKTDTVIQNSLNEINVEPISTPVEDNLNLSSDTLNDTNNLLNDSVDIKPVESTMAPIFSAPESNLTNNNSQVLPTPVEFTPIEPILKSADEVVVENNNSVIEPIIQPIVEPIVPMEPKIEPVDVPTGENNIDGTITIPVAESSTVVNKSVENTEIEEIL